MSLRIRVPGPIPSTAIFAIVRPSSDVSDGLWTTQAGGTALSTVLDETVRDDADYARSDAATLNDVFEVHLSDPASTLQNGTLKIAIGKETNNSDVVDVAVELRQGTTTIASWAYADVAYGAAMKTERLTDAQFATITDMTDLRVRVTAGRFWTPAELTAGGKLARWWHSQAVVLDGSGLVQTMTDLSSSALDITQSTSGSRPTYEAIGGHTETKLPTLFCPGTEKGFPFGTALAYNGTNGASWSFVGSHNTGSSGSNPFLAGGTGGLMVRFNSNNNNLEILRQAQVQLLGVAGVSLNTLHVVGCDVATNSTTATVNGTSTSNSTNPGVSNAGNGLLTAGGVEFLRGRFCEAVGSALKWTTAERQKVDGYLAWKYRTTLDASHPYKNRPPFVGD